MGSSPASVYYADNTIKTSQSSAGSAVITSKYNYAGVLVSTTASNGSVTCGSSGYDAFGRTLKQDTFANGTCGTSQATSSTNTYDGLDRVHTIALTGAQTASTVNFYDGLSSQLIGQTGAATGNSVEHPNVLYQLNPGGAPVAYNQTGASGGSMWLNKDARGNIVALSDSGGSRCAVKYDPFGSPTSGNSTTTINPARLATGCV